MPKVTIMQEGMSKRAYIDGKEVSNSIIGIDVRIRPDEVPTVDFEMMFVDGFLELCDSDVNIKVHPETLQEAACIIRREFLKRGEWYDALVSSIGNCLEGITHEMLEKGIDPAKMVADRIIGLEEHDGSI